LAALRRQLADRVRHLALDVLLERDREVVRKGHVELSGNERQCRRRPVADDRILDAVEMRPARLPVIRVARYRDPLVRLELDEFKGAGADRMAAHLTRRHMAGIDRRVPGGEQHQKRRLRPLQMKGDLVMSVGADPLEVAGTRICVD